MSTLLFSLIFALQLVTPAGAPPGENQQARDAKAATTYIVDTVDNGTCNNPETEINECEDGSCMGYDSEGNPVGCSLDAALSEAGGLGGGTVGFDISGTFNTNMTPLAPNVSMDGTGKDVTITTDTPFFTPPQILIAAGNNLLKGVNIACQSGQSGIAVNANSDVQIGDSGSGGVRIDGCDIGLSITSVDGTTTITNTTIVNNRLGVNVAGSSRNIITNNFIGVNNDGKTANGNTEGLKVLPMASNTSLEGNVISGNSEYGIRLVGEIETERLQNVKIHGNFIGVGNDSTTAIPNGQSGIEIFGPARNIVIGEDTLGNGRGNVIAHNEHQGIRLMAYEDTGNGLSGAPDQVTILKNIIKNNGAKGIYASESTVLPEKPVLQELKMDTTGIAPDTIHGTAFPGSRVDIYITDSPPDEQGAGEGEEWISTVIADSTGAFKSAVKELPPAASCSEASAYTATVIDSMGSTSVFAENYRPLGAVVQPQYRKIFLQDVPLENRFTVKTDWGNTPVEDRLVTIRINEVNPWKVLRDAPDEFAFNVDMGSTSNGLNAMPDNEIEVRISGCLGSEQEILHTVSVVKAPDWLETDKVEVLPKNGHVIYQREWKIPDEPIEASVTIPSEVPYWSGLWGLDKTQFEARFNASSLGGTTEGLIEGNTAFGLGPYLQIAITAEGLTELELTPQQLGPFTGDLTLGASGSASFRKSICIPTPFGSDIACVKGGLTGSLDLTYDAPFEYEDEVIWEDGEGTGHPALSGNVEASVSWPVSISFGVTVDGTAVINFGPPDNLNLNGEGKVVMTPHIAAFDENYSTEIELYDFAFGGAAKRPVIFNTKKRTWAAKNQDGVRAAIPPSSAVSSNGTIALAAVASGDNDTRDILLRLKKENQSEISMNLTTQEGRNLYPTAAFTGDNELLVVWMHSDDSPPASLEEVENYAGSFDLSYALVDVASESILESGRLTEDSHADMDPKLVQGTGGSVLLAWASLSGTFGGSDENPMSFKSILWNNGQWQAETVAAENLGNISSWDVAHLDVQNSLLTFTTDESEQDDASSLVTINRTDGNWESPSTLNNGSVHAAVHAAYESSGEAKLLWARDSMMVASTASSPANADTVFSIIPDDYNLLAAGEFSATNGRFFFGWPGSNGPEFVTDSADTWTRPQLLDGFEKGAKAITATPIPSSSDSARVYLASLNYSDGAPVTDITSRQLTIGERLATSTRHREDKTGNAIPEGYTLHQNYPNPFNPSTQIPFALPKSSHVKLAVYDILGREVETLVDRRMEAGRHTARFNAHGLSSGVYLYRITTGEFTKTKQLILLK
ncbi:T9SS type A sorting domain-containing protein [Gracilimonas mengyeensis]|uniref:Por secretion system C-terminal sorting domain-containing protein n=1 Tax=Gracilimonas mengyeensis TaxID=1302730 RepID=A0A521CXF6_9BACT|nr:T9SS type A sorting domain-containing protein [Gracilimonas mengyeensis]SMO64108.1 Por secretion system C-terminal sorting domain-containing protein [Gracilimonas mengyeensis]